jgi:crotonobetainyl-CoA:carnitine CoA-transferase CaiB-like acyl-CoA transferase
MAVTSGIKPLDGVRITDFTLHQAGPYSTHFLAVLGAQCIKIESAQRPDTHRKAHPVYGRLEPSDFDQANSEKLSVTLNLKTEEGKKLAKRLVSVSEIAAECFRPGVMARLGLSYEVLSALRPELVMLSVSASGQVGPEREDRGYAPIFSAVGGLAELTGYVDGPPVEIRNTMDNVTGLTATLAVLGALYKARKTGVGEHVDLAAREVASSLIGDALAATSRGVKVARSGNEMPFLAPHGIYPCRGTDEWISISVANDVEWNALCETLNESAWSSAEEFGDADSRWLNRQALDVIVGDRTRHEDAWDLTYRLQAAGVKAFKSVNARDIVRDRHLRARGTIRNEHGETAPERAIVSSPWQFSETPVRVERWMPRLGEHNEFVFGEILGISTSEIKRLIADGVID